MTPSPDARATTLEWLVRIRSGDEVAFEALFRAYAPGLCAFVARFTGSRTAAEDIVQELFLAIWRNRERIEIQTSFSSYLHTSARNRALDWLAHEDTVRRHRDSVIGSITERDLSAPTESQLLAMLDLQEAIERLPPRCRLIFTLSRQHDLSHAEIARSLGLSIKTVEVQIGRALKALRVRLSELAP